MDAPERSAPPPHPLLGRQLRRLGLSRDRAPSLEEWRQFLEKMGAAYEDADRDRDLLERSLAISSVEMRALYDDLKRSTDNELMARSNELQASTAIANAILDATYTGILLVSTDNKVLKYNRAFLQMCPVPMEILATGEAERVFACAHSKLLDADAFLVHVQSISTRDQPTPPFEIRFTSGRTYEVETYPVLAHDGARVGRLWAFSDSTARARERREMLELNSFLDSIVENIPDMIFVKEVPSMRFVRINRAGEQLLGYREIELLGRADHELFPEEQADGFAARDQQALREAPRPLEMIEETIKTRHLGERVLATRKIAILDAQKRPSFVLGISRDITEQKQAAEEIRQAKETAEQASRAKSDFLANMSHELRTPLNAILGFARVLQSSSKHLLPPREQQWVKLVTISGEHMLQLINDLLDLREAEVKPLKLAPIVVKDAVDESVAVVHWLYEENDLTLLIETPPDTPLIEGEYRALVQALINLLSNAAKFTPRGGRVELRVSHDEQHVFVTVSDTGIGIAAEHLPLLFTFYQRFGGKQRHQMKGSGVGLALTRQLIEAQGGSITVTSEEHRGSEFRLQLRRMDRVDEARRR